jgi:hypothetical protein
MQHLKPFTLLALAFFLFACSDTNYSPSLESAGDRATEASGGGNGQGGPDSGQITAGEWNDLANWDFWLNLGQDSDFRDALDTWNFNTDGRVSINVRDEAADPIIDAKVELFSGNQLLYTARTNNAGRAELFTDLYENLDISPNASLSVKVNGQTIQAQIKGYSEGINEIVGPFGTDPNQAEIAFLVDATGSMGDELEFLKQDLTDVLLRIRQNNSNTAFKVASVFYRDEGDEYVTRHSGFSTSQDQMISFIRSQEAAGGGDFPEAVHSALSVAINDLQWSDQARARIAFLLLDAPPHEDDRTMDEYRALTLQAAAKGIRVVPVVASGIGKPTEFLMRLTAIATNGSYIFITNDSGIGNDHIEPTIGDFDVEFLNDLLVRVVGEMVE